MFDFLKTRYQKIKNTLGKKIGALFSKPLSEETLEELEQILYEADLGSAVIQELIESIQDYYRKHPKASQNDLIKVLEKKALTILQEPPTVTSIQAKSDHPQIILMVGINGSGKTTTVAKLASYYQKQGKKVLIAAGDTFRAAAADQLEIWAERLKLQIVRGLAGADPSSVIFDALKSAIAKKIDIVIADTAGRLDSKIDLMKELDKIYRVIKKFDPDAPHEVLLVIDGNLGQNVKEQALTFHKYAPVTGFVVSKLDGSAKGGVILGLYREMGIPVKWIGVGEGAEDLVIFDPENYVEALFTCKS
jgi:fused signal recognition particle receptor